MIAVHVVGAAVVMVQFVRREDVPGCYVGLAAGETACFLGVGVRVAEVRAVHAGDDAGAYEGLEAGA